MIALKLKLFECRLNGLLDSLDYTEEKPSYHETMVIFEAVVNPSTNTIQTPAENLQETKNLKRNPFFLYVGSSQYIFGDYSYQFGEMIKRRFLLQEGMRHELFLNRFYHNPKQSRENQIRSDSESS